MPIYRGTTTETSCKERLPGNRRDGGDSIYVKILSRVCDFVQRLGMCETLRYLDLK